MIVATSTTIGLSDVYGGSITQPDYRVIGKGYETPEDAYKVKESYSDPDSYIIVKYWC